ncbi:MAG: hypothetical protein EON54_17255 [Alcaligenaceae bacterium]|nr:MAG: hypothetical protein EON54_17255 [Alcaligenaceae bacterium]
MEPLLFSNGEDFLEMHLQVEEDSSLPSHGDAYVTMRVASAGFTGHNDFWIQADALRNFAADLVRLDGSLSGQANLESISPNELNLTVRSVSSRGHLAIAGSLGYEVRRENSTFWHSAAFGFEFEPAQLAMACQHDLVRRYAG